MVQCRFAKRRVSSCAPAILALFFGQFATAAVAQTESAIEPPAINFYDEIAEIEPFFGRVESAQIRIEEIL